VSITRKALLVISLPILFQIAFVGVLAQMEHRADNYRVWQTHSSETSLATYRLLGVVLDADAASKSYVGTRNPAHLVVYRRAISAIPRELVPLRALSALEESERAEIDLPDKYRVSDLEESLRPLLAEYEQENRLVAANRGEEALAQLHARGPAKLNAFRAQVGGFLAEEGAVQQRQQRDWQDSQRNLRTAVIASALLNVMITISVLLLTLRGVKARLARLVQNTDRLGRGEQLFAPVEGGDEIAQLDASFHAMAAQLQHTEQALHREMWELAEAQHTLTQQKQALEELNAEKNRFIGMAAHDLRNPLFAVSSFADVLKRREPLTPRQLVAVEQIQATVRSMKRLVDDFLDASKIESGTLQLRRAECDIASIARACVDVLRAAAEQKQIALQLDGEPEARAFADGDKIGQVVTNLVSNALKFSPIGSTVTVGIARTAQLVELAVRDEGAGIAADELHLLFRPFSMTTTDSTAGESRTGLGLAICRRIIEEHGGTIAVESVPGRGSTFRFVLPLEPSIAVQPS
jgi:signal transduction histidine kinase